MEKLVKLGDVKLVEVSTKIIWPMPKLTKRTMRTYTHDIIEGLGSF